MTLIREDVLAALKEVKAPSGVDIVEAGLVRALTIDGNAVRFVMEVDSPAPFEAAKAEAEDKLKALGAASVSVVMTAHSTPKPPPDLKPSRSAAPAGPEKIPGVDRIIAIASGKGGVGKSTVASNLACALVAEGRRVGLLDADVYGPSQPRMLGVSGRPQSPDGKIILPLRNFGVTMMSIGLMTNEDQAVVWR
jgi:ATP-binding protein involved in chromosome partitioning